ncbi:MAG: hypothetical protein L3K26_11785, partial [Candidatus Hydrogenedentes bacterium]|nr:hypothetical protein [Candidatus Hydrogenedentota bacterium]
MASLSPGPFAAMLATVATFALVLSGCADKDCTLIGCANEPVALVLLGPNWMPLEPAVYALAFELDGVGYATTCSAAGTDQSCEPTQGSAPDFEVAVFVTTNNQIRINV